MKSHNEFSTKGFTVKFRPWTIVYQESFSTKSNALKREKELKSAKGREFIWAHIRRLADAGSSLRQ